MDLEDNNFSWGLFGVITGVLVLLLLINYIGFPYLYGEDSGSFKGELVVIERDRPFMTVKLGLDPVLAVFSAAERCFGSDLSDFSSCAVVDPSGLRVGFDVGSLFAAKELLNVAVLNGEVPWVVGELQVDWRLEDSVSSVSDEFFLCTEYSWVGGRTVSVVSLTRDVCFRNK